MEVIVKPSVASGIGPTPAIWKWVPQLQARHGVAWGNVRGLYLFSDIPSDKLLTTIGAGTVASVDSKAGGWLSVKPTAGNQVLLSMRQGTGGGFALGVFDTNKPGLSLWLEARLTMASAAHDGFIFGFVQASKVNTTIATASGIPASVAFIGFESADGAANIDMVTTSSASSGNKTVHGTITAGLSQNAVIKLGLSWEDRVIRWYKDGVLQVSIDPAVVTGQYPANNEPLVPVIGAQQPGTGGSSPEFQVDWIAAGALAE